MSKITEFFIFFYYMDWFNYYGLIFITIIMIPNIVVMIINKNSFENFYQNKIAEIFEQIGRYGCFILMIFNIPYTWFGFYFNHGLIVYLIVNSIMVFSYCLVWIILWKKECMIKAILLSVIPSLVFIFSGIILAYILLIAFSIIFAVTHILISVKNSQLSH